MRAVDQELGLFEVMSRFFFEGLGSMQMGEAIEALKLFTPAETVAWKRFLDRQGEAIDTGDTSLYDFTCLPSCDNEAIKLAFQAFSRAPDKVTFDQELIKLRKPPVSSAPDHPLASRSNPTLYLPGISDPLKAPGCPTSTSNLLSLPKNNELDENGLRPRRSGRTRSPNARYADKSYSLDHSHSKDQHAAQESEDGDEDEEDRDGTNLTFRIRNTSAHGPQPGKPDSGNDDFDDDFSEEDEVNRSSDLRGKRKAGSATRQQNAPSKKLKASSAEERVFDQARGRPRTIVPLTSTPPPKGRVPPATADADEDVEPLEDDEDEGGDGVGTLETVTIRQAAKDRWAPLKSGAKEWRHEYLNKVHSQTVLYYFDLMSRVKKNGNWQLIWKCRCCGKPRSTPSTGFSNLSSHIRAKPPIPHCHMRKTPCDSAVRPWTPEEDNLIDIDHSLPPSAGPKSESAVVSQSRRSMDKWRSMVTDQANQKQTKLQRRAVLVWVVMTAQPFTAPSNPYFRSLWATANPDLAVLKSPRTLVRDMEVLYDSLFGQAIKALRRCPGRFALQHDTWTTPSRREAFLAVHATWIDEKWQPRASCIGFERLGIDHTGAAFAGHLAGLLDSHQLWSQWSGIVVSDAAESNVRAIRFIEREITSETRSLPTAICQKLLPFSIRDNVVLCFAHGLNRAVVDGTAAAGAHTSMVSKDTDKIIRPAIFLDSTEVGGSIQRLDKVAEPEAENQDTHANQAAQATDGQMDDIVSAARVDREYAELQQEVDEIMEELGGGKDGASGQSDFDAEVEGIVDDYNADPEDDNVDSAITRLHNCLVKIRSSTKQYKMFKELVAELYPGEKKRTLPSLRGATRWNSFLVELRGCVRIQKAFTRLVNKDDEGIWTGFRVRPAEWTAMNQLCQVLETAELVSLDVQAAESSIADVLFVHRILRRFMVTRLEALHDVHEDSPAYGVKKAILAIQIKLEKYETKAKANKMVVAASILHPRRRRKPLAPSPDGESASVLLGVMADRFLGKESVQPSPKPRNEPTSISRYGVDIDSDEEDDTTVTVPDPSSSEIDIYLSGRYEWTDDYGPDTTKGALTWWRQHAQFLPRLAKLAQILLAVPSTTAIAERGFSHAGIFCSPRRNLGANSITMLTTCKLLTQSGFDPYKIDNQEADTPARNSTWTTATTAGPSISQRP